MKILDKYTGKTVVINKMTYKMMYFQAGRKNCCRCAFHLNCKTLFGFLCEDYWIDGIEPIYFEKY